MFNSKKNVQCFFQVPNFHSTAGYKTNWAVNWVWRWYRGNWWSSAMGEFFFLLIANCSDTHLFNCWRARVTFNGLLSGTVYWHSGTDTVSVHHTNFILFLIGLNLVKLLRVFSSVVKGSSWSNILLKAVRFLLHLHCAARLCIVIANYNAMLLFSNHRHWFFLKFYLHLMECRYRPRKNKSMPIFLLFSEIWNALRSTSNVFLHIGMEQPQFRIKFPVTLNWSKI